MTAWHLNDEEFDRLLAGEELAAGRAEHLRDCLACRRRRDGLLSVIEDAAAGDPDDVARARVRQAALGAWSRPVRTFHRWWLAVPVGALLFALGHGYQGQQVATAE